MPVILTKENYQRWLDGDESVLQAYTGPMISYAVDQKMNSGKVDNSSVIEPVQTLF